MTFLRPVTDLHQVSYEGLHLRCHVRRYRDVDACSSRHCHEATRIAISIERTRSRQYGSCNAMTTLDCAALDHSWLCGQISWAETVTAKLSDRADCRLWVGPCIGWSREHATEHERDSASLLSFHVTGLFVVCSSDAPRSKLADPPHPTDPKRAQPTDDHNGKGVECYWRSRLGAGCC